MDQMLKFDLPKNQSSIIKVIGVGGGGSNAVSHMYRQGITGVDFLICNTDAQAMEASPVPVKIQLGSKGLGAGSVPEVGKESAVENIEDIKRILEKNTKMVFITAGMGGGTGTGAAPVIAKAAREMDILTVGIVTLPFAFEGRKRKLQAESGIEELRKNVDTLLMICNDKLREVHGDLKLSEAFQKADNILTVAAKGIAEIITVTGYINVDFEDVKTVMKNSGTAIMGSATAEGENRAVKAVEEALASPLLNDNQIKGADNILLYIASGNEEITMDEVTEITDYIQEESGKNAEIIWGNGIDETLGNRISVTLVATGFNADRQLPGFEPAKRRVFTLTTPPKEKDEQKATQTISEPITEITLIPKKEVSLATPSEASLKPEFKPVKETPAKIQELIFNNEIKPEFRREVQGLREEKKPEIIRKPVDLPVNNQNNGSIAIETEEIEKKSKERIRKLRDLSMKLQPVDNIEELENTPAYVRRNVSLNDVKPSSESNVSRFTLSEGDDKKGEIKTDNSYLHTDID
jgi:cell division protein FtsZ